jgi:RNA polymerase sigma-70 factor, ECF subfamily
LAIDSDPLMNCSDEEMLLRFRNGEEHFFGMIVRRYQRELYGYLRRYLQDAEQAEDVFQATFLQLFLKADQYESGRPFRPWLYRIAIHQAIDAMRRSGRRQLVSLDQTTTDGTDTEERSLLDLLESREADPLEESQSEERRQRVRAWVDTLPDFLRQVVILAYYQGLRYREIADILEVPVGTIKSRLHTALIRLQEHLKALPSLPEL